MKVKAPVDKVEVVFAVPSGVTVPVKEIAPATLPLPPNTPVAATLTELEAEVLPFMYNTPLLI